MMGCSDCLCMYCLYWWSARCPYGGCWDDWRAIHDPWKGEIRKFWSNWNKPGEQEHWCRGGALYPADECPEFVQYDGQKIEDCHRSSIQTFQDGYRICPMMTNGTCEQCLKEMTEIIEGVKNDENSREAKG